MKTLERLKWFGAGVVLTLTLMAAFTALASSQPSSLEETITVTFLDEDFKILLGREAELVLTDSNGEAARHFIYNDTIYGPFRAVAEALGAYVEWNSWSPPVNWISLWPHVCPVQTVVEGNTISDQEFIQLGYHSWAFELEETPSTGVVWELVSINDTEYVSFYSEELTPGRGDTATRSFVFSFSREISESVFSLTFEQVLGEGDDKVRLGNFYVYEVHMMAEAKPIIYLYPETVTDVRVELDFNGILDFTYPLYNGGWSVTAHPDGKLINHDDEREYSYLFWEGRGIRDYDMSKGFVVKGEETIPFLQETLEYMGLIPQEYNEFIVFWLPFMQNNPYNLISFQYDTYTDNAGLRITPEPDSLQRVFMVFKPLDSFIDIEPQILESFERQGFAVIEWGGAIVN